PHWMVCTGVNAPSERLVPGAFTETYTRSGTVTMKTARSAPAAVRTSSSPRQPPRAELATPGDARAATSTRAARERRICSSPGTAALTAMVSVRWKKGYDRRATSCSCADAGLEITPARTAPATSEVRRKRRIRFCTALRRPEIRPAHRRLRKTNLFLPRKPRGHGARRRIPYVRLERGRSNHRVSDAARLRDLCVPRG